MPGTQGNKWELYYAADPTAAPWDTHSVSLQLQRYLCACPFYDEPGGSTVAATTTLDTHLQAQLLPLLMGCPTQHRTRSTEHAFRT